MSHLSLRPLARRSRAAFLAVALLGMGLVVLGLGAGPARAAQHAVMIKQYAFMPRSLSIQAGDTVTWTNEDSVGHDVDVTAGPASFHSPMLAQGQSWSFRFTAAGTYSYICSVHPDMTATVTVAAAPVQPATQPARQPVQQTAPVAAAGSPASAAPARSPAVKRSAGRRTPRATAGTPVAAAQIVTPGSDAALDPLLLVGGVAVAVVMFCLLLLTSRPERPLLAAPVRAGTTTSGSHSAHLSDITDTAVELDPV